MTGEQWVTVADAARTARVRPGTIRVWIVRGAVRSHLDGRRRWVELGDVLAAERTWRQRVNRDTPGQPTCADARAQGMTAV